jgi:hypothetical protein
MAEVIKGRSKVGYLPKGQYEYLLCANCDAFLNIEYETYFSNLWYEKGVLPTNFEGEIFAVSGIDYSKFKLCLLSILWRSSISSREVFSLVSLPQKHEERIRQMLLEKDPGNDYLYQIFATLILSPGTDKVFDSLIASPMMDEFDKKLVCTFVFGGCYWLFVIDENPLINSLAISSDGHIQFPVHDLRNIKPIVSFLDDIEKANLKW